MSTPSLENTRIPEISFKVCNKEGQWEDWKIQEMCKGRRVVFFSLPGAFTPTCTDLHLPKYEELYDSFIEAGVHEIYCVSVNDTFVMSNWADSQGITKVKMLPDGNGSFTKAMGLLVDNSTLGLGHRSWRYSMLVEDNIVKKAFIEPKDESSSCNISDAVTILRFLNPSARFPHKIAVATKKGCFSSEKAKSILEARKLPYVDIPLQDSVRRVAMEAMTGSSSVPQVWIDGKHVGGLTELESWFVANSHI